MKQCVIKMISLVLVASACALTAGCDQTMTRSYGGSSTLKLDPGKKLVNLTWKGDSLWILTRPMKTGDLPETYEFSESASIHVLEGKVTIVESR